MKYIEVFQGPVLALTDGNYSGVELAGPHRPEWGAKLHSFKLGKQAAKDLVASLTWALEHGEFEE